MTHPSSQSSDNDLAAHLRRQLVESLLMAGVLHTPALQQAFLHIPREAFVPSFYEQETASRTMAWKPVSTDKVGAEAYLTAVYRDQSLVTKIDERGWPISASSQPSIMAKMLEALEVQPGHRVLEIGTGSGCNAAVITLLTGEASRVVTIERDAELAATARNALESVLGAGVSVIVGDGVMGWQPGAPYDRIIATASAATLPLAWVDQLRPGGRLVMDLQGRLASGFLVAEKNRAGRVAGYFLSEPLYFMPLETDAISMKQAHVTSLLQQPPQATFVLEGSVFPDILFRKAFRWFLQWQMPGCQISKQVRRDSTSEIHAIVVEEHPRKAVVRLQKRPEETAWRGEVYGTANFWQELQDAFEAFHALGEPGPQRYQVVVGEEGPALQICSLRFPLSTVGNLPEG
jgi:protein-L-isoaspartate(D-aspartate) O-methyltransferase